MSLPIGVEMHLQGAGTRSEDGWYTAVSSLGRYQIRFPIPYDEWSALIGDGKTASYNLSATSAEGIKFLASEVNRVDGEQFKDVRALAKSFLNTSRKGSLRRNFVHQGVDGAEVVVKTRKSTTTSRFFLTANNHYHLSVEYPNKAKPIAKVASEKFFNSLKLNTPDS